MPTPDQLKLALQKKNAQGQRAFTTRQVADQAIAEDSFLGKKIDRAMRLGVTRQQAMNFYAFGSAHGEEPQPKPKTGFFESLVDHINAPGDAVAGAAMRGLSNIPGLEFAANTPEAQQLPENLKQSAATARVVIPAAAGLATGGMSMLGSAAVSGIAGAGASTLGTGLEAAAGEEKTLGGAAMEAGATGLIDAGLDAATMGLFRGAKALTKLRSAADLSDEVAGMVGKIVQGNADDIAKGSEALRLIDTSGVETYDDLAGALNEKIKAIAKSQDDTLAKVPGKFAAEALEKTTKVGEKTAKSNAVKDALTHLEELYGKIGEQEDMLRIQNLGEKAAKEGLSVKEINDIAREYGGEFGKKAFSERTGEALTSVNARLYETVRKGVKETSRSAVEKGSPKISPQTKLMAEFFGTKPENVIDEIKRFGGTDVNVKPLDETTKHLGEVFQKPYEGWTDFLEKKLGDAATAADYNAAEVARLDATTVRPSRAGIEAMDSEMSALIGTRKLAQDMAEKVQLLANKVEKRGIGEKIGRVLGKGADILSGGSIRGFVSKFIPSNVGLKTLNALDLQNALSKNLAKVDALIEQIDSLPSDEAAAAFKQLILDIAATVTSSAGKAGVGAATNALQE